MATFTDKERKILEKIVTNVDGDVFCITGLPPELSAAVLVRYSRAATGFKETILKEFVDSEGNFKIEKGSEMMHKILNQFLDASAGNLSGGPALCLENVSNLVTKIVEDRRIGGSPIEKSTRYVVYDQKIDGEWGYLRPKSIMNSGLAGLYTSTMDFIFETYASMASPMKELFQKRLPKDKFAISVERDGTKIDNQHEYELINDEERKAFRNAYTFTIRCAACDIIRCVLPAATKTNVGLSGNGTFYTNLLTKMMSMNLPEANEVALKAKTELDKIIPTFVYWAGDSEYLIETDRKMRILAGELLRNVPIEKEKELVLFEDRPIERPESLLTTMAYRAYCFLSGTEPEYMIDNQVAEMLFAYSRHPTAQLRNIVKQLPHEKKLDIFNTYVGERKSKRDRVERAFEYGYPIRFDIIGGFAEYRDLQRHRMLTQQRQELGVDLGYSIPEEVEEIGCLDKVQECFGRAEHLHSELKHAGFEQEAQYAALFNHFIRWYMGMNPREFEHFTELRTQKAGHPRYRRIVQNMAKMYLEKHSWMEPVIGFVDYNDYDDKIARAEAEAKSAYNSLVTHVENKADE